MGPVLSVELLGGSERGAPQSDGESRVGEGDDIGLWSHVPTDGDQGNAYAYSSASPVEARRVRRTCTHAARRGRR
jgi:hypothetical protein